MKKQKIFVIDGLPVDEFYRYNAAPISLFKNENYEILLEQEMG
jgi:hypothetical protein